LYSFEEINILYANYTELLGVSAVTSSRAVETRPAVLAFLHNSYVPTPSPSFTRRPTNTQSPTHSPTESRIQVAANNVNLSLYNLLVVIVVCCVGGGGLLILLLLYCFRVKIGICINNVRLFCCDCCGGYRDDDDEDGSDKKKSKYDEDDDDEDGEGKKGWFGSKATGQRSSSGELFSYTYSYVFVCMYVYIYVNTCMVIYTEHLACICI
jgi:hypothetical protein